MEQKINVGDIVNIKSDKSMKMTVESISDNSYVCIWFDCTFDLKRENFNSETLEKS